MEKSIQEDIREIAHKTGECLREAKADKAQYTVTETQTHEFNVDGGEFSLFRTLFGHSLTRIRKKALPPQTSSMTAP